MLTLLGVGQGQSGAPLFLDGYTAPSVAYSLRKVRSAYVGNCIRVRRSSDDTEQDIGFSGSDLDTASLLSFCGAGNGFIKTWYNQGSTTSADLGQTTKSASLPVTIASDQDTLAVSPRANTVGTGGTTPYKLIATGSTNANSVKASAGNLYSIVAIGLTANVRYLKLYNKASSPTVGTDTPIMTIPIPGNTQGAGVSIPFSMGVNFGTGIALAITTGAADADTGAVTASDVIINLTYA